MFDGGGLYLEVAPSGGKWWRLKYRHSNKEKRLSLGIYPDVGLKAASALAEADMPTFFGRLNTYEGDASTFYPGKSPSDGTLNSALARLGYKGVATAHGFRTLFSTCANEAGWPCDRAALFESDATSSPRLLGMTACASP